MRKQVTGTFNSRDFDAEEGERVIDPINGKMYDLVESSGRNKAASGELTAVLSSPQKRESVAKKIDGVWYWTYKGE